MKRIWLALLIACDAGRAAPSPGSAAPPVAAAPVDPAERRLTTDFDPAIVGTLAPRPVVAGDYAMALDLTFASFVTMELHISSHTTGEIQLRLATDGTATACVAVRAIDGASGDYTYQPADKRTPYRETDTATVRALTGKWKPSGNLAAIQFTGVAYRTCDPGKAVASTQPVLAFDCVATSATTTLPAGSLACVLPDQAFELGMPYAKPATGSRPAHDRPRGRDLVLAPGGLHVKVEQREREQTPRFTLAPGAVMIDTKFYGPRH